MKPLILCFEKAVLSRTVDMPALYTLRMKSLLLCFEKAVLSRTVDMPALYTLRMKSLLCFNSGLDLALLTQTLPVGLTVALAVLNYTIPRGKGGKKDSIQNRKH